mgnify:FL=1|jgi:hypothetical protein
MISSFCLSYVPLNPTDITIANFHRPQQSSDLRLIEKADTGPLHPCHTLLDRNLSGDVPSNGHRRVPIIRF